MYFFAGAFLITYGIAMLFCGIPIFFQEVAIGQYLGAGGMTLVSQLCPLLQGRLQKSLLDLCQIAIYLKYDHFILSFVGVGYATMTIVFFLDIYYCIIIAWTLFYLISTFINLPGVPWSSCGKYILRYTIYDIYPMSRLKRHGEIYPILSVL